jgi:hypothetical protein
MTVPAAALSSSPATGLELGAPAEELLARASQPGYQHWLSHAATARGCFHPVRLSGEITDIDPATGELLRRVTTSAMPDGTLYVPCGTRRASICPACAETYRRDAYQIVKQDLTVAKASLPTSRPIRPSSSRSPRRLSGSFIPVWAVMAARCCVVVPAAKPLSARMAVACRARAGTKRPTLASASRCARTATTMTLRSSGTPMPPSYGGAP